MSAKRKLKRAKQKQAKKDVQVALGLFDKIPEHCLTCHEPYDRVNKEQVMSWRVVVREQEEKVNLYCPDCWQKATNLIEEMQKELSNEETDA
jgi:nitrate/TMAO reductase-like tetraheme cytochrome c subunit